MPVPAGFTADAPNEKEANVTWTDTSDGETGFVIEKSTDGTAFTPAFTTPQNATGWSLAGLTPDTDYWLRVKTKSGSLESEATPKVKVHTKKAIEIIWGEGHNSGNRESWPHSDAYIAGLVDGEHYLLNGTFIAVGSWDGTSTVNGSNQSIGPDRFKAVLDEQTSHAQTAIDGAFTNQIMSEGQQGTGPGGGLYGESSSYAFRVGFIAHGTSATFSVSTSLIDANSPEDETWSVPDLTVQPDPKIPTVSIEATDAEAWEVPLGEDQDDTLKFTVTRSGNEEDNDFDEPLTVKLHAPAGVAVSGADYNGFENTVTIPAGAASAQITATATADDTTEVIEQMELCLEAMSTYRLGGYTSEGTIRDVSGNIGFNNDNGPASDPGDKLRPGTPDAGFVIDGDYDKTEDQGEGFKFWWDDQNYAIGPSNRPLTLDNLTNLAPFIVDVPNLPSDLDLEVWLKVDGLIPLAGGIRPETMFVYNNPAEGQARLNYLKDPGTAQTLIDGDDIFLQDTDPEKQLVDAQGRTLTPGRHEFLMRVLQPSPNAQVSNLTVTLTLKDATGDVVATLDSAKVTMRPAREFYSVISSRDPNAKVNFVYPTDDGRTQTVQRYSYDVKRDKRQSDVKKTAIFIHGYDVSAADAETTFATTYQRMFWQGFRGNFVGWDWDGQQSLDPVMFNTDVENALHTAPALWSAITDMMFQSPTTGGWGLGPQDIDVVAHSLGNVVMWDALRINAALTPKKLVHNVTSIEAAIFREAFDPVGPLSYSVPSSTGSRPYLMFESVAQQQQSGWRSWFNPSGRNIRSSVAGKIINSYNPNDSSLDKMRLNEFTKPDAMLIADRHQLYQHPPVYRSSTRLNLLQTYIRPGASLSYVAGEWVFTKDDLNHAIGTMQNPIANVNVDASALGQNPANHSDFRELNYPTVWSWWFKIAAQEQAVAVGVQ